MAMDGQVSPARVTMRMAGSLVGHPKVPSGVPLVWAQATFEFGADRLRFRAYPRADKVHAQVFTMPDQPEPACLVLADISGYTSYLAGVELDHAQDILADLTDAVVRALRPTFRLAKLEGDAAFAYVITDVIDGSALQDTIEHCYIAFRRRLRDIGQASQCDCNACTYIPRLDLKFVVHHGLIARQRMAGREELVGRDVIVVHRLLKNDVQTALGMSAYALVHGRVRPDHGSYRPGSGRFGRAPGDVRVCRRGLRLGPRPQGCVATIRGEFGVHRLECRYGLVDIPHLRWSARDRLGVGDVPGPPTQVADRGKRT